LNLPAGLKNPLTIYRGLGPQQIYKIPCNRFWKNLVEWQVNPPAGFNHKPTDNSQRWTIELTGALAQRMPMNPINFRSIFLIITPWKFHSLYASSRLQQWSHMSRDMIVDGLSKNGTRLDRETWLVL